MNGGYRAIVDWLEPALEEAGHQVERIYLPFVDDPETLFEQMLAFRLLDLAEQADRVITFRPPAHVVQHPKKVVWFIHHIRGFYDLWDTPYRPTPDSVRWRRFRGRLHDADTRALQEAHRVFSNSKVVSRRLETFNGVASRPLYPPVRDPQRFASTGYGDAVVMVCRLQHHKRQHLLVEAMSRVKTPVRLVLCGEGSDPGYVQELSAAAERLPAGRVTVEARWISEEEKAERIADALAVAYSAFDEDSYGYPTLEGAHACKAAVVMSDGGGVLEFVLDGETGFVVEPDPAAVADAFDRLWSDRAAARAMGEAAHARIDALQINWRSVVSALTA